MKVESYDGTKETRILALLTANEAVLGKVASRWTPTGRFSSPSCNLIAGWCIDHYRKYGKAPGPSLRGYLEEWADTAQDDASRQLAEDLTGRLLEGIEQTDPVEVNCDREVDRAGRYFNLVEGERLQQAIQEDVRQGRADKLVERVYAFRKVELGMGTGADPFTDPEPFRNVFRQERMQPLFRYPGALGAFFADEFSRNCLVAFMAPEGSGKSFWLLDIAYRSLCERLKVAYFDTGDMTEDQVDERIATRLAQHPTRSPDGKWPYVVSYPRRLTVVGDDDVNVDREQRSFKQPLTPEKAERARVNFLKNTLRSNRSFFRRVCFPNSTASVHDLRSTLKEWASDGFEPDVICIAQGSLVLTHRGLVPIENVKRDDRLWDGVDWVSHGGLVFKGVREVITYAGLTGTPDHKVWTEEGWRTLESCSRLGLRVAETEFEGKPIRIGESYIPGGSHSPCSVQEAWSGVSGEAGIRACRMCAVRVGKVGVFGQFASGDCQRVPSVFAAQKIPHLVLPANDSEASALPGSKYQWLETLRWEGNRIQVPLNFGCVSVDHGKFGWALSTSDHRPNRQRWTLRAWQHPLVHTQTKLLSHAEATTYSQDAPFSSTLSTCQICGRYSAEVFSFGSDSTGDCGEVEGHSSKVQKSPVWDLLNAGPLHRFTVQGILAHNCVDYADIMAPLDRRVERRDQINDTWKALRTLSQELHCLVVTATQANREGYKARVIRKEHTGEDKRKQAAVSVMFGLNATDAEQEMQVMRINRIKRRRGGSTNASHCVYVAGCLALADPAVLSAFKQEGSRSED